MKYTNARTRLVIVYRPPSSKENGLKENDFFGDFNILLERLANTSPKLLITGDVNLHVNKPSETYAKKFLRMLKAFNLEHVSGPTHKNGNTLDLLITSSDVDFLSNVPIMSEVINPKLSNHHAVRSQVKLKNPLFVRKNVTYRKLRSVNIQSLQTDIKSSTLMSDFFGI